MRGQFRVGIGRCEFGDYPWDRWATRARVAGMPEDLLQIGHALVREAYQHGWPDRLCVLAGWHYVGPEGRWEVEGEALIAAALKHPSAARVVWEYLLATDGEQMDAATGADATDLPRRRPREWMTLQGCLSRQLRQLKAQRTDLLRFPEANDLVTIRIGAEETTHIGTVDMSGADDSIVVGYSVKVPGGRDEKCRISLVPSADGRAYREREGAQRTVAVVVIDDKVSNGVPACPCRGLVVSEPEPPSPTTDASAARAEGA